MDSANESFYDTTQVLREIAAPCDAVFAAWLDAEGMCSWMCSGETVCTRAELDPQPGGRFAIDTTDANGAVRQHSGQYQSVKRPQELCFSWTSDATEGRPSIVTLDFRPTEAGCNLVLTHQRLPSEEAVEEHAQAWTDILGKLDAFLTA